MPSSPLQGPGSPRMFRFALMLASCLAATAVSASAEALDVAVDHARIVRISEAAGTIIIGNPAIVDASVHDARTIVLTGRSYGTTNVVVLNAAGGVLLDESVTVSSVESHSVRVYRQAARTTYSCMPQCEPRVTIGDDPDAFGSAASQFSQHDSMAKQN